MPVTKRCEGGVETINNTIYDLYGWGQSNVKAKLVRQSIHIYMNVQSQLKLWLQALSISFNFNSTNKHLVSLQQMFTLKA